MKVKVGKTYETNFGRKMKIVREMDNIYYSECGVAYTEKGIALKDDNCWNLKL